MGILEKPRNYNPGMTNEGGSYVAPNDRPKGQPWQLIDYGTFKGDDEEYNALNKDYEDFLSAHGNPALSRDQINALKSKFGISTDYGFQSFQKPVWGTNDEGEQVIVGYETSYGDDSSDMGRDYKDRNDRLRYAKDAETDTYLGQAIEAQLAALRPRIEANRERKLFGETEGLLGKTRTREQQLRDELLKSQSDFGTQLDTRMNLGLQEAGIKAGEARALVGSTLAQRGLGRSTFGSRALNEVTSAEQEQKGGIRSEANKVRNKIGSVVDETLTNVANKRKSLEINRNLSELKSFQDIGFQIDTQAIKDQFANQIANAELSANDKAMWFGLAGSILGGGAKLLAGAI